MEQRRHHPGQPCDRRRDGRQHRHARRRPHRSEQRHHPQELCHRRGQWRQPGSRRPGRLQQQWHAGRDDRRLLCDRGSERHCLRRWTGRLQRRGSLRQQVLRDWRGQRHGRRRRTGGRPHRQQFRGRHAVLCDWCGQRDVYRRDGNGRRADRQQRRHRLGHAVLRDRERQRHVRIRDGAGRWNSSPATPAR